MSKNYHLRTLSLPYLYIRPWATPVVFLKKVLEEICPLWVSTLMQMLKELNDLIPRYFQTDEWKDIGTDVL